MGGYRGGVALVEGLGAGLREHAPGRGRGVRVRAQRVGMARGRRHRTRRQAALDVVRLPDQELQHVVEHVPGAGGAF